MMERMSKMAAWSLPKALEWCARYLVAGRRVFCVRERESGLVVTYLVDLQGYASFLFDGRPTDDFTVTEMLWNGTQARFGVERLWKEVLP